MTPDERDAALRARFHALAEDEAANAPPFVRPRVGPRRAIRRPRLAVGAAAAILALAALGYARWAGRARPVPFPIDPAAVTWIGPTDFLLETPGAALLREIPALGIRDGAAGAAVPSTDDDTLRRNRT
jgi:hypothetical protein